MDVRARHWVAFGALALAVALLAPAMAPLSGSMDSFATSLANGTFRPFGQFGGPGAGGAGGAGTSTLGGFTGESQGNYVAGAGDIPRSWPLDRDGRGGNVTIDSVFNPDLGAMKRLKAFDRVAADGATLLTSDATLRPLSVDSSLRYDRLIDGAFPVQFHRDVPIPIFSPHPKALIERVSVEPALVGGVQFFKDATDTFYALGHVDKLATLNITYRVSSDYYAFQAPEGVRVNDYRYSPSLPRPSVPTAVAEEAKLVLARAGVADPGDVGETLSALTTYFRSFTEGSIPPPTEIESLYLALALGGHGCCRHRAFAFMVTAQSVGIPTRVIVNEAHAFVEVALPSGHWHQINLGGCGSYRLNNPNNYPPLFDQADDPREEANPDESLPVQRVPTETVITDAPTRIIKGERYLVGGTVRMLDGRPVPGARVDLFLNVTKDAPGRFSGTGTTGLDGRFNVSARVPADAPAQGYQLVARGSDGKATTARFGESWSDPPVEVFAPTRFVFGNLVSAAGYSASLRGRIVDIDGAGVPGATLSWSADGTPQGAVVSDGAGRFTVTVLYNTTGNHALGVRFDGTQNHGASNATATVVVSTGAILVPPDAPVLVRGVGGLVTGDVAVRGVDVGGREVVVASAGQPNLPRASGFTDRSGHFAVEALARDSTPLGVYNYTISIPSLALQTVTPVRVAAGANLSATVPERVTPGDAYVVEATLESDNGTRIAGGIVELKVGGATTRLLTNRTGVARFDATAPRATGDVSFVVAFPGDADHAATSRAVTLHVARAWYALMPAWAYALVALALILAVLLVPLLVPGSPARARAKRVVLAMRLRERRFLAVAFPDHPPGTPPVFEPRERMRVRVVARDEKGVAVDARVAVSLGGVRAKARTSGEAGARLEVPAPERTTRLRVQPLGLHRLWTRNVELVVPVASYREAVERGFVALRTRARLDAAATPGDLVERAGRGLDAEARSALVEAAALFALADYTETPVDRAFYHAFAAAAARAGDAMDGAADG